MLPMKPRRLAGWRALCMVVAIAFAGCRPPSQIESDAAFGEVDALFTAVTSHRTDLLEQCQQRLEKLSQQGDVSTQAFQELTTICEKANARLKGFFSLCEVNGDESRFTELMVAPSLWDHGIMGSWDHGIMGSRGLSLQRLE